MFNQKYIFSELVSKLSLPDLNSTCLQIFNNFASYHSFLNIIEEADYTVYKYLLELPNFGDSKARKIERTLKEFEPELLELEELFNLKTPVHIKLTLAITGPVQWAGLTKEEFISYCNRRLCKDLVHINLSKTITSDCDYVICAGADDVYYNTIKKRKGLEYRNLLTPREFINRLKLIVNNWEETQYE